MTSSIRTPFIVLPVLIGICGLVAGESLARAASVDQAEGSYRDEVVIATPAFHDLGPGLRLTYGSQGGLGQLGVGWTLQGVSYVERASPGGGAPNYDSSDIWLLDGTELVDCTSATALPSPSLATSCWAGGNFTTKTESYLRITKDSDGFTVTQKNGTQSRYATALGATVNGTTQAFRYYLSQVVDRHGNQVSYTYWSDYGEDMYLDSIAYGGVLVKLYREDRSDPVLVARGAGQTLLTSYRLKFIAVSVDGSARNGYALDYSTSTSTGRSVVSSIATYGSDGSFSCATTCTVLAGTPLPAMTFAYDEAGKPGNKAMLFAANAGTWGTSGYSWSGDFNGDGKTDIAALIGSDLYVKASTGTSFAADSLWTTYAGNQWGRVQDSWVGDFNGDGKDDIATGGGPQGAYIRVNASTGSAFAASGNWESPSQGFAKPPQCSFVGDFNGDGKDDVLAVTPWSSGQSANAQWMSVNISNGTSFSESNWGSGTFSPDAVSGGTPVPCPLWVGDFNGDGKADVAYYHSGTITMYRSTGWGFVVSPWASSVPSAPSAHGVRWTAGDFNGDGKLDLAAVTSGGISPTGALNPTGSGSVEVLLSTGSSFVTQAWALNVPVDASRQLWAVDADGDGRTDIITTALSNTAYGPSDVEATVFHSTGTNFTTSWASWGSYLSSDRNYRWIGDFDGDGRTEFATKVSNFGGENGIYASLGVFGNCFQAGGGACRGGQVDVITQVTNGMGGTSKFTFTPSNSNPPRAVVASVTSDDGRGDASTSRYTYAGGHFNRALRQFVGFSTVTSYPPALAGESPGPSTETDYDVTELDGIARPIAVYQRNGSGIVQQATKSVYAFSTVLPYRALEYQTSTQNYNATALASWTTTVTKVFDVYNPTTKAWTSGYGNLTAETHWGDTSGSQAKTIKYQYPPDTGRTSSSPYIVGKPSAVATYDQSNNLLAQNLLYYDGATSSATPIQIGDLTQTSIWLDKILSNGQVVSANAYLVQKQTYDGYGDVLTSTAPDGAVTTTSYATGNHHLFPLTTTNALHQTTSYLWSYVQGLKLQATFGSGATAQKTSWEYDVYGRMTSVTSPDGAVSRTQEVNFGDPSTYYQEVDVLAATGRTIWARSYKDGYGRTYQTAKMSPNESAGVCTYSEFDARGNPSRASLPHACNTTYASYEWSTQHVDGLNRITSITAADGTTSTTAYDLGVVTVTDPLGHVIKRNTNSLGQLVSQSEYDGSAWWTTSHAYDTLGRKIKTTDPKGNVWSATLDSLGRAIVESHPDHGTLKTTYDAMGRALTIIDALGQQTTYAYDALGRTSKKTTTSGTTSFRYDEARTSSSGAPYYNAAQMTSYTDVGGSSVTLDYDVGGRVARKVRSIGGSSYTQTASYARGGWLTQLTYPDGEKLLGPSSGPITYDDYGRPLNVVLQGATGQNTTVLSGATFDALYNRPLTRTLGNGLTSTFTYDPLLGHLTSVRQASNGVQVDALNYQYDADGQLTKQTSSNADETWTYTYDALHRLTQAQSALAANSESFAYDALGNLTNSSRVGSYSYGSQTCMLVGPSCVGGPHAVTGIKSGLAGTEYTYDSAGHLIESVSYEQFPPGLGLPPRFAVSARGLRWSGDGMLTNVDATTYAYDALGARINKTVAGVSTAYLDDDYEITNGVVTKYIRVGGAVLAKRVGTTTQWVQEDARGSIWLVTDSAGKLVARSAYRPYGEIASGGTGSGPGYTGQREDESNLVYLHARYYDPHLGRFISPDPTTPTDRLIGLNTYAYAANNPTSNTDIDGHGWFSWVVRVAKIGVSIACPQLAPFIANFSAAQGLFSEISQVANGKESPTRFVIATAIDVASESVLSDVSQFSADAHGVETLSNPMLIRAIAQGSGFVGGLVLGGSVGDAIKSTALGTTISIASSWIRGSAASMGTAPPSGSSASPTDNAPGYTLPAIQAGDGQYAFEGHGCCDLNLFINHLANGHVSDVVNDLNAFTDWLLDGGDARSGNYGGYATNAALLLIPYTRGVGMSEAVLANKVEHIFGNAAHQLEPLVQSYGSERAAFSAVQRAVDGAAGSGALPKPNIFGILPDRWAISVGSHTVEMHGGRVVRGMVQIGSFGM